MTEENKGQKLETTVDQSKLNDRVSKPFPEEEYKRWLKLREKHDELSTAHKIAGERFNFEAATKYFDEAGKIAIEMNEIYDGIMAC